LPKPREDSAGADGREVEGGRGRGGQGDADASPGDRADDGRGDRVVDVWDYAYELAGILRVHPGEWSVRQLHVAVEASQREGWNHTCAIIAQIAEVHRDPKQRSTPFTAAEIHPMRKQSPLSAAAHEQLPEITPEQLEALL
jgi:hypothetical protein